MPILDSTTEQRASILNRECEWYTWLGFRVVSRSSTSTELVLPRGLLKRLWCWGSVTHIVVSVDEDGSVVRDLGRNIFEQSACPRLPSDRISVPKKILTWGHSR